MTDLFEFRGKLKYELHESIDDHEEASPKEDKETDNGGYLGIRRVNSKEAVGKATKDFNWEVDFDILRKAICKEVMTIDLNKTKKLFRLFKNYINNQKEFEEKYK